MYIEVSNVLAAQYVASILSVFSLCCSLFFIYVYLFSKTSEKFYLKLVFYLQISDTIQSFGLFLCIFNPTETETITLCRLQSFLLQFGSLSSILWRSAISIIMYISIKKNAETAEAQEIRLILFVFWISILLSVM